jgi:hypothetical protein
MTSHKTDYREVISLRKTIPLKQTSYWTDEEKSELESMFYSGIGITEMALHFSRSEPAIINMLDSMKLYVKMTRNRSPNGGNKCRCLGCEYFQNHRCILNHPCERKNIKIQQ